jgi:hypothetical protein
MELTKSTKSDKRIAESKERVLDCLQAECYHLDELVKEGNLTKSEIRKAGKLEQRFLALTILLN